MVGRHHSFNGHELEQTPGDGEGQGGLVCCSPSNEYSGLISFRIDWFGLLAVQGTLKSLLQHHSSKASILWRSAFLMIQLSHPYMTTGKTMALTVWTFVSKVMSLLLKGSSGDILHFMLTSLIF